MNTYHKIANYLMYEVPIFAKKSGFDTLIELLGRLGNPHKSIKFIHVAGTNGKGSVCKMMSDILVRGKYKTGLFTSPHILKINERIKIDDIDISDDKFVEIYLIVNAAIKDMIEEGYKHPTFFETMFIMSLMYFKEEQVDLAIIEVGIGGRLDSTNVIENSLLSIITNIGFDHTDLLGHTIKSIASEKSGIIKEKGKVIINSNDSQAIKVFNEKSRLMKAKIINANDYNYKILKKTGKSIDFSINNKYYGSKCLSMKIVAEYQIENVSTVLAAISCLQESYGVSISDDDIKKGLASFSWMGRMEFLNDSILLEGAHNESGIRRFVKYMNENYRDRQVTIVFSMINTKDFKGVIKELAKLKIGYKVIVTSPVERSIKSEVIVNELLEYNIQAETSNDIKEIININTQNNDLLCFVGSLYLISQVKKIWEDNQYD